jgi:hypothetical protein
MQNFKISVLARFNLEKVRVKSSNRRKGIGVIGFFFMVLTASLFIFFILYISRNRIESRPRSKSSIARREMRSLATGIESYYVDHDSYPAYTIGLKHSANGFLDEKWESVYIKIPTFRNNDGESFSTITTPVAYITSYFSDPCAPKKGVSFAYYSVDKEDCSGWILWSPGPDEKYDLDINSVKEYYDPSIAQTSGELITRFAYDPTNGNESEGDVFRVKM